VHSLGTMHLATIFLQLDSFLHAERTQSGGFCCNTEEVCTVGGEASNCQLSWSRSQLHEISGIYAIHSEQILLYDSILPFMWWWVPWQCCSPWSYTSHSQVGRRGSGSCRGVVWEKHSTLVLIWEQLIFTSWQSVISLVCTSFS